MLSRGRTALRRTSISQTNLLRTPVSRLPRRQLHLYTCTSCRDAPLTTSSRSILPSIRHFSTTLASRKDKPPESDDPSEQVLIDEAKKVNGEEEAKPVAKEFTESKDAKEPTPIPQKASSSGEASSAGGSAGTPPAESGGAGDGQGKGKRERGLTKPSVPDVYPQVMAIPIGKRPLFPGFYKAITIKDPQVAAAIQEMIRRGQPYIGAFLFKDDGTDKDTIGSMDEVHDVGTFCQITSAFPVNGDNKSITAVLYPHRRIKLSSLTNHTGEAPAAPTSAAEEPKTIDIESQTQAKAKEEQPKDAQSGNVVASFEESKTDTKSEDSKQEGFKPSSFLSKYKVSVVNVDNIAEPKVDKHSPLVRALSSEIVNVLRDIAAMSPLFRDQITSFSMNTTSNVADEPAKLADFVAAVSTGETEEMQAVLSDPNIEDRLQKALVILKKELFNTQLQQTIAKNVEGSIQKRQREYYLMEQRKAINKELGLESDGKDKLVEKFKGKADKLAMPEAVRKVFDEELSKLGSLEPAASEFNVTRNYLDWLTQIPWGQRSAETFSIKNAKTILDEDHHGMKDVKDRILEFIAVGKLRGTVEGKIICFVGPPGVGKTSIGKSIARALNRQYYRFSVGGLTDVAEIKGHRRTYVGALPGRIIQALKKCQTENPLILIDEVDKIGRGVHGDPSSALLELLDPEQNNSFLDHYMDVPVDLSKVLFVCTANQSDTIPRPLLDRMEMIELSGYVSDEKMAIAQRYLAPAAKELAGLKEADVKLEEDAVLDLINRYCRESGVRNLKKQIEKVYRKSALKIIDDLGEEALPEEAALTPEGKAAQEESKKDESDVKETPVDVAKETTEKPRIALQVPDTVHVSINKDNLKDYVGPPIFTNDRLYDITPPGVAMGLAWTSMGGTALYIETILENALTRDSRAGLETTGSLKSVMKESTSVAYSFAKSVLARQFPDNRFFQHARLHLHCPEGATPKDGPSAGITMASSMLSLALDSPLDPTVAMTGELTVTGRVLRIGGLREKTVAARRAGAKMVIFPDANMSDWLELPENIREGIEGKPVKWYSDVFDLVFPNLDKEKASSLWKEQLKKEGKKDKKEKKRKEEDSDDDD